jgi:AcrR family transcriptional regulator
LRAAGGLILEAGIEGFTIEGVAERSGASKVTIYKWWPSKGALALDGFFSSVSSTINTTQTNDSEGDLTAQVDSVLHLFRDTLVGRVLAGLIGEAQWDADLAQALRDRWLDPRRKTGIAVLRAAVVRGELSSDLDLTMVLDQIYGAIYIRLLTGHAPLEHGLAADLVHNILHGIGFKKKRDRHTRSPSKRRRGSP